jgi:hypothetical protein
VNLAFVLIVLVGQTAPGPTAFQVEAKLNAEALTPGQAYAITISYELGDGFTATEAGLPAPLLQIDIPPFVHLTGTYRDAFQQQLKSDFLHTPYEQLLSKTQSEIGFELKSPPAEGATIELNVVAYLQKIRPEEAYLVRRRLALPLTPAAVATEVDPAVSSWGPGGLLQIGDKAEPFELPRADESTLSLSRYLGHKNIVVLTYRAHW